MQICIVGVGAMACLMAARLYGQAEVWLVGHWPAQIAALQAGGLTWLEMESAPQQSRTIPVTLFAAAPDTPLPPADLALVLVKSTQTDAAAATLARCLTPNGLAVTLQNGLGNVARLAAVLGQERVTGGSSTQGAIIVRPGVAQHTGNGPTYLPDQTGTRPLAALFNQAGMPTYLQENLDSLIWGKLIINAGINPLTALLRQPNGFLAHNDTARLLLARVVTEAAAVAQANGIPLPYPDPIAQTLEVARVTAANYSSMLQDVQRGATTEIEAITGAIIYHGQRSQTLTPLNTILYQLIQNGARPLTVEALAKRLGYYEAG
ncbi:MAG: 2-dehydropantoate 2-reductase [Anaerolineae bacterium]|nr:2-dehydropantoate 2-reductase [Anaerolineae bacterium]